MKKKLNRRATSNDSKLKMVRGSKIQKRRKHVVLREGDHQNGYQRESHSTQRLMKNQKMIPGLKNRRRRKEEKGTREEQLRNDWIYI